MINFTIVSQSVYLPAAPLPVATFSSHGAAFEATRIFHEPTWKPIGESRLTTADKIVLAQLCAMLKGETP